MRPEKARRGPGVQLDTVRDHRTDQRCHLQLVFVEAGNRSRIQGYSLDLENRATVHRAFHQPVWGDLLQRVGDRSHQENCGAEVFGHLHLHDTPVMADHDMPVAELDSGPEVGYRQHEPKVMSQPMTSRAMVVVGSGSSSRFGGDKLMATVAGEPIMARVVRAVSAEVDQVVLVCRQDHLESTALAHLDAKMVVGGETRTQSEMAGLRALDEDHDLVGIHDAARPLVGHRMIESLFAEAGRIGGAVPVVAPRMTMVDSSTLAPVVGLMAAQTPQVFRFAELRAAYLRAEGDHFEGYDTAEVVSRYSDLAIAAVPGDPTNIKVTYPDDLRAVREILEGGQSRS